MPKDRFPIPDIASYTPNIDPRGVPTQNFVLQGENFLFDPMGPKSGFGSRIIANGESIEVEGGVVQSIQIAKFSFVFTTLGVYMVDVEDLDAPWSQVLSLTPFANTPIPEDKKWTAAYLAKGIYFVHPVYGMYVLATNVNVPVMTPKDQDDIPGLPYKPQAICETNGRMVVLGIKYIGWSNSGEPQNFIPEIGGAGQQLLSDRVSGNPLTMSGFQTGFIVWTDSGCMIAEFIGGDTVFRFDRSTTKQLPINAFTVEDLPNGSQILLTKQGLFITESGKEPTPVAPLFSDFLMTLLKERPQLRARLTYQIESDLLYAQLRDWTDHYVYTYVLAVSLDKWGIFSERHLGIIRYSPVRGAFGYCDSKGIVRRFVETFTKEETPGVFVGLDSFLEIGYIRPPNMLPSVDVLLEMQELLLGGVPARPSWSIPDYVDLGPFGALPPPSGYFCLDFMSGEWRFNGVVYDSPTELLANYNGGFLGGNGYEVTDAATPGIYSDPLNSPPIAVFVAANVNDPGVTFLIQYRRFEDPELNDTGWVLYLRHKFDPLDPDARRINLQFDQNTGLVTLTDLGGNIALSRPLPNAGVARVGITLARNDGPAEHVYSLSVNGSTVSATRASTASVSEMVNGVEVDFGWKHDVNAPFDRYFQEPFFFQQICIMESLQDADLTLWTGDI
jgi:hypothetical protein